MNHDIDAYVDGLLSDSERARFEAAMARDPELAAEVGQLRTLRDALRALPAEVEPQRDLWPAIEPDLPSGRKTPWRLILGSATAGAVVFAGLLCAVAVPVTLTADPLEIWTTDALNAGAWQLTWDRQPTDGPIAIGHAQLREGDLVAADISFEAAVAAHPDHPDALVALAYTSLLKGQHDKADHLLASAEALVEESQRAPIQLRRALVAFETQDLDAVFEHAEASQLPPALVLAAEIHLADAEIDEAVPLLERAADSDDARVASTARQYLDHLRDGETGRAQLAECTALWALGQRAEAVEAGEDLLVYLPHEMPERDELLLLWAGRAVATSRDDIAETLLDQMSGPPAGQIWRTAATRAMIASARGERALALEIFDALDAAGAPEDGLRDARLTAALVAENEALSKALLAGLDGPAAALLLRDPALAVDASPALDQYLRSL